RWAGHFAEGLHGNCPAAVLDRKVVLPQAMNRSTLAVHYDRIDFDEVSSSGRLGTGPGRWDGKEGSRQQEHHRQRTRHDMAFAARRTARSMTAIVTGCTPYSARRCGPAQTPSRASELAHRLPPTTEHS